MIWKTIYNTILEALFPVTSAEQELFLLGPEQVLRLLPSAPPPPIPVVRSVFAYKDPRVTQLVWNVKYKKSPRAVAIAGLALYENLVRRLETLPAGSKLIIVPMPITERRRRERGYNQCELLTSEIARLDPSQQLIIRTDILERIHHSSRQTLKAREQRLESAKGIFAIMEGHNKDLLADIFSEPVVIIDDVITTGSTIKEAIACLRTAGFTNVSGLSVAH